jgi:hypothetical protein
LSRKDLEGEEARSRIRVICRTNTRGSCTGHVGIRQDTRGSQQGFNAHRQTTTRDTRGSKDTRGTHTRPINCVVGVGKREIDDAHRNHSINLVSHMRPKKCVDSQQARVGCRGIVDHHAIPLVAGDGIGGWKGEPVGTEVVIDGTPLNSGIELDRLLNRRLTNTNHADRNRAHGS